MKQQINLSGIGMTSQRTRDRLLARLSDEGISNIEVLDVIRITPRHIFVEEAFAHRAYEDTALPIGHGQTISQPYMVARMTEVLLMGGTPKRVLEVGTGSGYQTAILAQLVDEVFSMERIKPLQDKARDRLKLLGLRNVYLKHADAGMGWDERAPFDGIMVTAAPREVPKELLAQLAPGGKMVIPVGEVDDKQQLRLITKNDQGEIESEVLHTVKFVPFLAGSVR